MTIYEREMLAIALYESGARYAFASEGFKKKCWRNAGKKQRDHFRKQAVVEIERAKKESI